MTKEFHMVKCSECKKKVKCPKCKKMELYISHTKIGKIFCMKCDYTLEDKKFKGVPIIETDDIPTSKKSQSKINLKDMKWVWLTVTKEEAELLPGSSFIYKNKLIIPCLIFNNPKIEKTNCLICKKEIDGNKLLIHIVENFETHEKGFNESLEKAAKDQDIKQERKSDPLPYTDPKKIMLGEKEGITIKMEELTFNKFKDHGKIRDLK